MNIKRVWLLQLIWYLLVCIIMVLILIAVVIVYFDYQLPSKEAIRDVHVQVPLRIYSNDHKLIAQFGAKRRIPVTLDQIPKQLIQASLATEDQRFYEHAGVDLFGLLRAALVVVTTGHKAQGGSTITMQVARNYFLNRRKTYARKMTEILLAYKLDRMFSKDKILELYFNKIFYGHHAYGVGAAARTYYGKKLKQLSLAQIAMLAGLPKAPSALNPLTDPQAAKLRRAHVLENMLSQGYITQQQFKQAVNAPITASYHGEHAQVEAPYVATMIDKRITQVFGEKAAHNDGLVVTSTIDSGMQKKANHALRQGVLSYEKRHGYKGPVTNIKGQVKPTFKAWQQSLQQFNAVNDLKPAATLAVNDSAQTALMLLKEGRIVRLPWSGMQWARPRIMKNGYPHLGDRPDQPSDILEQGDVVYIDQDSQGQWQLSQKPKVEGALVAMDPHNGAVKALVGGFSETYGQFNRVTQANRQAGSSFKPFVYSSALHKGYSLATMINDAPVVMRQNDIKGWWRPENDTRKFYGPTSVLTGLTKSRNLVSIRLLQLVGLKYARQYVTRFGFEKSQLPNGLSLALGTSAVTPMRMANAYSVFANGGYRVQHHIIASIKNSETGRVLQSTQPPEAVDDNNPEPENVATRAISEQNAYLMTQALRNVIQHGTGRAAKSIGRDDLAGKTGTSDKQQDGWFCGFNHDLVTVTWLGYDRPKSLHEYGAQSALPVWIDFMKQALQDKPESVMSQPPGIISMRINPKTGEIAKPGDKHAIYEYFDVDHLPKKLQNQQGGQEGTESVEPNDTGSESTSDFDKRLY